MNELLKEEGGFAQTKEYIGLADSLTCCIKDTKEKVLDLSTNYSTG